MKKEEMILNAKNLKETLWQTLQGLRRGGITPQEADAIATQSREIMRTTNTQLRICQQSKTDVPDGLVRFAKED